MTLRVAPEDVLRAVAVVDVEVDDRDALDAVRGLGVARGDRGVVEEAEAHRRRRFGVVAGRTRRHEGVVDAPERPPRRPRRSPRPPSAAPPPRSPATSRCRRRAEHAPGAARPARSRRRNRRDGRASAPRSRRAARSREREAETFRAPALDRRRADAAAVPGWPSPMSWAKQAAWLTSSVVTSSDPHHGRLFASAEHRRNAGECPLAARSRATWGSGSGAQLNDLAWASAAA